jgi:hypothetical protein
MEYLVCATVWTFSPLGNLRRGSDFTQIVWTPATALHISLPTRLDRKKTSRTKVKKVKLDVQRLKFPK